MKSGYNYYFKNRKCNWVIHIICQPKGHYKAQHVGVNGKENLYT